MNYKKIALLLVMIIFVSFLDINYVKAVAQCNIGVCDITQTDADCEKGYGTIRYTTDKSMANANMIQICRRGNDGKCGTGLKYAYIFDNSEDKQLLVEFNGNKATGAIIKTAYIDFYENKDDESPVCRIDLNTGDNSVLSVDIDINHGKVNHLIAGGTYLDENGVEQAFSVEMTSVGVHRILSEGEEPVVNDENISSEENPIESSGTGSSYGESQVVEGGSQPYTTTDPAIAPVTGNIGINIITDENGNIIPQKIECGNTLKEFINKIWKYFIIFGPILLIIMSTLDFFKALFSSEPDMLNKAASNTVKRTLATIILLMLPLLLSTILDFFGLQLCL